MAYIATKGLFTLEESERTCECEQIVKVPMTFTNIDSNWKSISWRCRFYLHFRSV